MASSDSSRITMDHAGESDWLLGCACDWGAVISPFWRGSACLRSDQYMYVSWKFARHKCLLPCMGVTAQNANNHRMNLDALYILY